MVCCMKGMMKLPMLKQVVLIMLNMRCFGVELKQKAMSKRKQLTAADNTKIPSKETSKVMPLAEVKIAHGKVIYITTKDRLLAISMLRKRNRLKKYASVIINNTLIAFSIALDIIRHALYVFS